MLPVAVPVPVPPVPVPVPIPLVPVPVPVPLVPVPVPVPLVPVPVPVPVPPVSPEQSGTPQHSPAGFLITQPAGKLPYVGHLREKKRV